MPDPAVPPPSAFNFTDFARNIYSENTRPVGEEEFLLPALYGGEAGSGTFKALVVLEAPSKDFTERHWRPPRCTTVEDAITRHREIFFTWAFEGLQAELFRVLVPSADRHDFFERLYITDVWKDADFKKKKKEKRDDYRCYWQGKLEKEIRNVAAERVIFVGREAVLSGCRHVRPGTPRHCLVFPSSRPGVEETFKAQVQELLTEIHWTETGKR